MRQRLPSVRTLTFSMEEIDGMELIRGWEKQYAPDVTGGLRLSKGSLYRDISGEEGLRDSQEGEIRLISDGQISRTSDWSGSPPITVVVSSEQDARDVVVEGLMPGETRKIQQHLRVEDSGLDSPFLFCLSKKPGAEDDWHTLKDALPEKYDTWTILENVRGLSFEIECGIKRWLALNEITHHRIDRYRGWVTYSYDTAPPSVDPRNLGRVLEARWFRKNKRYSGQQEYRLAWAISSPQVETFPDYIDIELTKTGLALFRPWTPSASSG